jgi:protein-disulfide isomerase
MPQIEKAYIDTGKVRYVFRDFPLSFHANAQGAAEASRCAGAQGAFWDMHHQIFEAQAEWSRQGEQEAVDIFVGYASKMSLDANAFRTCLESGQFAQQVAQDLQIGREAGVQATPSFLVNEKLLVGAHAFEDFQAMIEAALQSGQ